MIQATIHDIPAEILLSVFGYLTTKTQQSALEWESDCDIWWYEGSLASRYPPADLLACSMVCRYWRTVAATQLFAAITVNPSDTVSSDAGLEPIHSNRLCDALVEHNNDMNGDGETYQGTAQLSSADAPFSLTLVDMRLAALHHFALHAPHLAVHVRAVKLIVFKEACAREPESRATELHSTLLLGALNVLPNIHHLYIAIDRRAP